MEKLSLKEKIGYGLGDTATNLTFRTITVFLTFFYTDVFGISAATIATLFLIVRLWDACNDLIMGIIADRTNTRWGKFRPWILWMALPFGILTLLTFITPDFSYVGKVIYAYVTYMLLMMIFTASNIPYSALSGVMTSDPVERTSLSSYRFVGAFVGALVAQGLNIPLTEFFGKGDQVKGYQWTIGVFAFISVILFVITFLTTKERVYPPKEQKNSLKNDLKELMGNKPWIIIFFVGVLFVSFSSLRQGVTLYYFKYYINNTNLATGFMVAGLVAAMIGAGITNLFARKIGKQKLFIITMLVAGVGAFLLYFVKPDQLVIIYALNIIIEFVGGIMPVLFFAMLADSADYSEWKFQRRSTGIIFSAGTFAMKTGIMVAGAGTGWLLSYFGYVANIEQAANTMIGIRLIFSIFPAALILIAGGVMWFYPISESKLTEIQQKLNERRKS